MPPSWLALICIGQARGCGVGWGGVETKCIKRGSQDGLRPLRWGRPTLMPWGCIVLCSPNKILSCNQSVTLVHHFKSLLWQDRTKEITHSPDIPYHNVWELLQSPYNTYCALLTWEKPVLIADILNTAEQPILLRPTTPWVLSVHTEKQHMYDFLQLFLGW